jgi:hypothetical protein
MKLTEAFEAVKDKTLSLRQLEEFRDDLIHIHTMLQLEQADLEKKEAFYFMDSKEETDIAKKRSWRVTVEGQRLIELNRYTKAVVKEVDSLKSRIYSLI